MDAVLGQQPLVEATQRRMQASLRVGVAYLEKGLDGVEAAIARVRETNPRSALGYRRGGEQAAYKYRFDDAAALAAKAVAVDANDPAAQFDLGLYLLRTGDGLVG